VEALIIDGVRTPRSRGKPDGALHSVHPQELLAATLKALADRTDLRLEDIDDVVAGNASGEGDHAMCVARLAVLAAGWPDSVPGITVNRYCGSGQNAVAFAAMGVMSGQQRLVVAGGVESMSRFRGAAGAMDADNLKLRQRVPLVPQGISADLLAAIYGISRRELDAYGKLSHDRAIAAQKEGRFDRSLIAVVGEDGELLLDRDEMPRANTSLEGLAQLKPSFEKLGAMEIPGFEASFDELALRRYPDIPSIDHVHHAGNSSGVSDGASAILVAGSDYAKANGLQPRARIVQTAALGGEPTAMLSVPPAVSKRCLELAGLTIADIDLWEINEAFAVVPLLTMRELGIDPAKMNVNGGAIALGHPIGGTGPMLIQTALDELERRGQQRALIAMCTGGGMATATIIERI
jgi:acetyl-CoA C-acetyltransferase